MDGGFEPDFVAANGGLPIEASQVHDQVGAPVAGHPLHAVPA
jgi:hypothetical protein